MKKYNRSDFKETHIVKQFQIKLHNQFESLSAHTNAETLLP